MESEHELEQRSIWKRLLHPDSRGKINHLGECSEGEQVHLPGLDATGTSLDGANRYTVTFPKDQIPPVDGFWSLTLYDAQHFFVPNDLKHFSLGTKNKTLKYNPDGSLTLYVQAEPPPEAQSSNCLPAPKGEFSLYLRAYWPKTAIFDGSWLPPAVQRIM